MNGHQPAFDATLRLATKGRSSLSLYDRARHRVVSFLGSGDVAYDRNFLVVRPAIAGLVMLSVWLQGSGLPGAHFVYIGCSFALAYNVLMGWLTYRKRYFIQRALSLFLDNATIIGTSLLVFRAMGAAGYESDLWLVFFPLIVTNALYYGPQGSLFFTAIWTATLCIISFEYYAADTYTRDQLPARLTFLLLTGFVSISLSAELRKRTQKMEAQSRQTLTMLAQIVEARDTDAGQHLRHITHYSRALALHLGLTEQEANEVSYAAMIHDVGKAQVPDAILKKPGPLTPEERREIEKHTLWGYELLAENDEFASAREVARSHHERWDGTGYPDGLAGEDIPLAARITAVADVYDALISERPYKHAWPAHEAIAELKRLSGTHMDPEIVAAFVQLYDMGMLRWLDEGMRAEADAAGAQQFPKAA